MSQMGTLCSSTMCAAVCFGNMCISREKTGCLEWGRVDQRKILEDIRQIYWPRVLEVEIERLQLCCNMLDGNLHTLVLHSELSLKLSLKKGVRVCGCRRNPSLNADTQVCLITA